MIVCHCIKDYSFDETFKAGERYYYHVDRDGCVFVYKHMAKYADEMFESLDDFHEYFKDY